MRTGQLIRALAADSGGMRMPAEQQLAAAVAIGFAISAALFLLVLGPRPDAAIAAASDPRFVLKFLVTLALAGAAAGLALRLIRPGASAVGWALALVVAPTLLALGIAYELVTMSPATWMPRLVGRNSMVCLVSIPLLSAPVLAALMIAMGRGAPLRPALAGAAAGLAAGGLGAALYAAHCVDDSPLFVMTWYGIAIALVTAVAALAGARWLRW